MTRRECEFRSLTGVVVGVQDFELIRVGACRLIDPSPKRCGVSKPRSRRWRLLRCGGEEAEGEVDLEEGKKKIMAVFTPLGR